MYYFSDKSKERLSTTHQDLQTLFNYVIKGRDCSIICGVRGEAEQNEAYRKGNSKLQYPFSKHNKKPSLAVDVIPYPFNGWDDHIQFIEFGNYVLGVAEMLKQYGAIEHSIQWGGNWNFKDYPHYEII